MTTAITDEHFLQKIQSETEPEGIVLAQRIYADWLEEQGNPKAELLRLAADVRESAWEKQVCRLVSGLHSSSFCGTTWLNQARVPLVGVRQSPQAPESGLWFRWQERPHLDWLECFPCEHRVFLKPAKKYQEGECLSFPIEGDFTGTVVQAYVGLIGVEFPSRAILNWVVCDNPDSFAVYNSSWDWI